MDQVLKEKVRGELFKCAVEGKFVTYKEFYERIHPGEVMGRFPYDAHFDEVAKEERDLGYPDITFLVHKSGPPPQYPGRIDFRPADPPDQAQLDSLCNGSDRIIALYCPPRTINPYR